MGTVLRIDIGDSLYKIVAGLFFFFTAHDRKKTYIPDIESHITLDYIRCQASKCI
jgi:hypothetical protein